MAKSLITQTLGGPSHGVLGLIEISDKIARLSEAEYAFETKRRKLEHQFEVTNSELREEYLAAVLEIRDSPEAKMTGVTHEAVTPNAGSLQGRPSHDVCPAAWAAVVTRVPRRSPLGPLEATGAATPDTCEMLIDLHELLDKLDTMLQERTARRCVDAQCEWPC